LILDDVAAELDREGKVLMGLALAKTGWQVFASGVEDPFHFAESVIWRVSAGKINEEKREG
jgi:recombinational DNA repair ATPase RecF